ncbi:MAG: hypothetical protein ACLUSP_07980 [Christensenellales bacterium]
MLRAFERELGEEVVRPEFSALMGAYGAALYAAERKEKAAGKLLSSADLASFVHETRTVKCGGCTNNCTLTVNTFSGGGRFIAGNKCSKPISERATTAKTMFSRSNLTTLTSLSAANPNRTRSISVFRSALTFTNFCRFITRSCRISDSTL